MRFLAGALAVAALAGCQAASTTMTGPHAAIGRGVSIALESMSDRSGPRLGMQITVGATPVKVMVDTGSTGLRVLASKLSAHDAQPTGATTSETFASGVTVTGDTAMATVRMGGTRTIAPILIQLIKPGPGVTDSFPSASFDGIIGIGVRGTNVSGCCANPMWHLPNGAGKSYGIHYDPAGASFLILNPPAAGYQAAAPTAGRYITTCFTLPGLLDGQTCRPALWDTGTPDAHLQVPGTSGTQFGTAPAGTSLVVAVPETTWSHSYTTGPGLTARVTASTGNSGSDTDSRAGLPLFTGADIRFDLTNGHIGFAGR
jgi:hypothetical protein